MAGIIYLAVALSAAAAGATEFVSPNCNKDSRPIYNTDFHWGYRLGDMLKRFAEIYEAPKRLGRHARLDARTGNIVLPYDEARGGDVIMPASFVASVRAHIENALKLEYVDAVFFPDMGHSHFLVPQDEWDETYNNIPSNEVSRLYERMMADQDLKVFYHTAEQLGMLDPQKQLIHDRRIQERFYTRNLVGDNRGQGKLELVQNRGHMMNTVGDVPGYYWYGAGFNVSANKDGCFVYNDRGVERYFDISLYDLDSDPNHVEDDPGY